MNAAMSRSSIAGCWCPVSAGGNAATPAATSTNTDNDQYTSGYLTSLVRHPTGVDEDDMERLRRPHQHLETRRRLFAHSSSSSSSSSSSTGTKRRDATTFLRHGDVDIDVRTTAASSVH